MTAELTNADGARMPRIPCIIEIEMDGFVNDNVSTRLQPTRASIVDNEACHELEVKSRQPGDRIDFEADIQSQFGFIFIPGGDEEANLPAIDGAATNGVALLSLSDALLSDNCGDTAEDGPLAAGPGSDGSSSGCCQRRLPASQSAHSVDIIGPVPADDDSPDQPTRTTASTSEAAQHAPPANPEKICDLVLDMDAAAAAVSAALTGIPSGPPPPRRAAGPCDTAAAAAVSVASGMLGARHLQPPPPPPPPPPRRSLSQHSTAATGSGGGGGIFFPYPLLYYHQPAPPPPPPPRQYLHTHSQPAALHSLHPPALPAAAAAAAAGDMSGGYAASSLANLTAPPGSSLSAMLQPPPPPPLGSASAASGGSGGGICEPPGSYTPFLRELPHWRVSISGPTVDLAEDGRAGPPQGRSTGRWHASSSSGLPFDLPSYSCGGYPPYAHPSTALPPYMSDQHVQQQQRQQRQQAHLLHVQTHRLLHPCPTLQQQQQQQQQQQPHHHRHGRATACRVLTLAQPQRVLDGPSVPPAAAAAAAVNARLLHTVPSRQLAPLAAAAAGPAAAAAPLQPPPTVIQNPLHHQHQHQHHAPVVATRCFQGYMLDAGMGAAVGVGVGVGVGLDAAEPGIGDADAAAEERFTSGTAAAATAAIAAAGTLALPSPSVPSGPMQQLLLLRGAAEVGLQGAGLEVGVTVPRVLGGAAAGFEGGEEGDAGCAAVAAGRGAAAQRGAAPGPATEDGGEQVRQLGRCFSAPAHRTAAEGRLLTSLFSSFNNRSGDPGAAGSSSGAAAAAAAGGALDAAALARLLDDGPGFFDAAAAAAAAAAALGGWASGGGAAADAPDSAAVSLGSSSALASLLESFGGGGGARSSFVLSPPLLSDHQQGSGGGSSWIDLTGLSLSISHTSPRTSPTNPLALRGERAAALAATEVGGPAAGSGALATAMPVALALLQGGDAGEGALLPVPHSAGVFERAAGAATGGGLAAFGDYHPWESPPNFSRQRPQPQPQFDPLHFTSQQQLLVAQRQRLSSGSQVHQPALSRTTDAASDVIAAAAGDLLLLGPSPAGPPPAPPLEPLLPSCWDPQALGAALRVLQATPHLES